MRNRVCHLLAGVVALFLVTSCSKKQLRVYTWVDYIKPELIARFEKESGCEVIVDTFLSNEELRDTLKSGASTYDIVMPSSYMAEVLSREGLLEPLNQKALLNLGQVDDNLREKLPDSGLTHTVPYAVSFGVIGYRKDKIKEAQHSWAVFNQPSIRAKFSLLHDVRDTLGSALKLLGFSVNTINEDEIQQAAALVKKWRQNALRFDNDAYRSALVSGELHLAHGYSGDLHRLATQHKNIGVLIPIEGVVLACDMMGITSKAREKNLAHRFIDFFLQPDVAAENMQWTGYICPNKGGLQKVPYSFFTGPAISLSKPVMDSSEIIRDLGEHTSKYEKAWESILADFSTDESGVGVRKRSLAGKAP
ncbi:MAG: spermidine/putrescine ABC transporter substrate-binding protein [Verrucomicrobiaceae bacterium]|nr:spermidine/putrescine ABC transporter substrate-binding protein [Verrucomicrobiaceae bacterium]